MADDFFEVEIGEFSPDLEAVFVLGVSDGVRGHTFGRRPCFAVRALFETERYEATLNECQVCAYSFMFPRDTSRPGVHFGAVALWKVHLRSPIVRRLYVDRALHRALGFKFRTPGILLRNFVAVAEHRGERVITTATVHEWALQAPSPEQRRNRPLTVHRFALSLHAEDPCHEVPSADLFRPRQRRTP